MRIFDGGMRIMPQRSWGAILNPKWIPVDFQLTEEQRAIRELAREFAQKEIAPYAAEWDRTGEFPGALYCRMAGVHGLMGLPFPEQYGGAGADAVSLALA